MVAVYEYDEDGSRREIYPDEVTLLDEGLAILSQDDGPPRRRGMRVVESLLTSFDFSREEEVPED